MRIVKKRPFLFWYNLVMVRMEVEGLETSKREFSGFFGSLIEQGQHQQI